MSDFRLIVFQSVARNLSFTKASQELFITQPAITKHIQELESQYKVPLFERLGNRISLTSAGQLLLKHCEPILAGYKQLDYEMNLLHDEHSGDLKLGASTTIAQYVLPPLLAIFTEKFPELNVTLINGNSRDIETALLEHQLDLGMVEGNLRQSTLKYTSYLEDELVAVVHTSSKLARLEEISLNALKTVPLVLRERGSGTLDVLETALQSHNIKLSDLTIRMQLGSTESIKRFLEKTDCMGVVSIRSISRELMSGAFKVIEIKELAMQRDFSFVCLHGNENGQAQFFQQFAFHYKEIL
ncbi:MAG: LysR family transcriptional regulator [Bacteroidota bacterium]|nr:LysR family transcriptional regulator [Bacteroidota bacterium]